MSERHQSKEFGLDAAALGAATVPLLLGAASAASLARIFGALGEASEELLRGDRLPVLPFPAADRDLPTEEAREAATPDLSDRTDSFGEGGR